MITPRKSTLTKGMMNARIPHYEEFFEKFHAYLLRKLNTRDKAAYIQMIENDRRDQTRFIISEVDAGYCPRKGDALKYVPAKVIMAGFQSEGYDEMYDAFVKKNKTK